MTACAAPAHLKTRAADAILRRAAKTQPRADENWRTHAVSASAAAEAEYPAMKATVNAGWLGGTATAIMLAVALTLHAQGTAEESRCLASNLKQTLRMGKIPNMKDCEYKGVAIGLQLADHPADINFKPSTFAAGRIFEQSPEAGSALLPDSRISLSVSNGIAPANPKQKTTMGVPVSPPVEPAALSQAPPETAKEGPTKKPGASKSANVSINAKLAQPEPYEVGKFLEFVVIVRNNGPSAATQLKVNFSTTNLANLRILRPADQCKWPVCKIQNMPAGAGEKILVSAQTDHVGKFEFTASVSLAEPDPSPAVRRSTVSSFATQAPLPWLWIVAAGALLAAAITMARAIRKWRWRRLLRITPSVELTGKSSAMPIAMAAPPLGLDAQLEIGEAAPIGPIPVSKLEKSDDN